MAEPKDIVLRVLREIQAEIVDFRKVSEERFAKLESGQRNLRPALSGETVLSRMLVGEYEERIEALERKVRGLGGAEVSPSSPSIESRIRSLRSRGFSQERYLRELIELADLEDRSTAVDRIDRIAALRGRVATLEKVRELELHK